MLARQKLLHMSALGARRRDYNRISDLCAAETNLLKNSKQQKMGCVPCLPQGSWSCCFRLQTILPMTLPEQPEPEDRRGKRDPQDASPSAFLAQVASNPLPVGSVVSGCRYASYFTCPSTSPSHFHCVTNDPFYTPGPAELRKLHDAVFPVDALRCTSHPEGEQVLFLLRSSSNLPLFLEILEGAMPVFRVIEGARIRLSRPDILYRFVRARRQAREPPHTCPYAEDCKPSCSSLTPAEFSRSHPRKVHGDKLSSFLGKIIFLENLEISFCWVK